MQNLQTGSATSFRSKANKMMKANSPTETAHVPEEEAHQPLSRNMPPPPVRFSEDEKPDSQSTMSYKDALSQPAECAPHRQRLLWLQERRAPGLWAQCDDCNRWRHLPAALDRHDLPNKWYCTMNPDTALASCAAPEIPIRIHEEEDLIYSEYAAGSLVVARMDGWPWWPAMVDDCPDTEQYYWLDGFSDIPTHYHVVFFDAQEVTRAWVAPSQLKPYKDGKKLLHTATKNKKNRKRLEAAVAQANEAQKLNLKERLAKYSFIARYKGTIATPKKINRRDVNKYQQQFKRKFAVELPNESSGSDDDDQPVTETPKKNVITVGSKKPKVTVDHSLVVEEVDPKSDVANTFTNGKNNFGSKKPKVTVDHSLVVEEVDPKSDVANTFTNDTSTTFVPDTTVTDTTEGSPEIPDRAFSPGSGDFDF